VMLQGATGRSAYKKGSISQAVTILCPSRLHRALPPSEPPNGVRRCFLERSASGPPPPATSPSESSRPWWCRRSCPPSSAPPFAWAGGLLLPPAFGGERRSPALRRRRTSATRGRPSEAPSAVVCLAPRPVGL
jgi:hypothetical protein